MSNYSLFVDRFWQGKNGNNHAPTSLQQSIRKHYEASAESINAMRVGRRVVLVHNGDAIEGHHHNNIDVASRDVNEQIDLHVEIMSDFRRRINWQRGDLLYYTIGTECHTGDAEDVIGKELNAVQADDGLYASQNLILQIEGKNIMFVHHGPGGGYGRNEGRALRGWLENIYDDRLKSGLAPLDAVYSGHTHQYTYNVHVAREGEQYRIVHGAILPSWQAKTRYAYRAAPVARNRVGVAVSVVGGAISAPVAFLMDTDATIPVVI